MLCILNIRVKDKYFVPDTFKQLGVGPRGICHGHAHFPVGALLMT